MQPALAACTRQSCADHKATQIRASPVGVWVQTVTRGRHEGAAGGRQQQQCDPGPPPPPGGLMRPQSVASDGGVPMLRGWRHDARDLTQWVTMPTPANPPRTPSKDTLQRAADPRQRPAPMRAPHHAPHRHMGMRSLDTPRPTRTPWCVRPHSLLLAPSPLGPSPLNRLC